MICCASMEGHVSDVCFNTSECICAVLDCEANEILVCMPDKKDKKR